MLVDLKGQALSSEVVDLIAYCLSDIQSDIPNTIADYYGQKESLFLKGYTLEDRLVGLVGYAYKAPRKILMTHLAVDPAFRNKGIARKMLSELVEVEQIKWIGAESTEVAVVFYEKLHFECHLKNHREDGASHFSCEWRRGVSRPF